MKLFWLTLFVHLVISYNFTHGLHCSCEKCDNGCENCTLSCDLSNYNYNYNYHSYSYLHKIKYLTIKQCISFEDWYGSNNLDLYSLSIHNLRNNCELSEFGIPLGALKNLETLNVSSNSLTSMDYIDSFDMILPMLLTLDYSNNEIETISNFVQEVMPNIESLYLQKNKITTINALEQIPKSLKTLDLSGNRIKSINLQHVTDLLYLDLSNNEIVKLDELSNSIETLYVKNNILNEIHITDKLKILDASHNNCTRLTVDKNSNLNWLNLTDNFLVNTSFLYSLNELQVLDMSNNRIANTIITTLRQLKVLNLRNNLLNTIDSKAFGAHSSLVYLDLSQNNISLFDEYVLLGMPSISEIFLFSNPFVLTNIENLINLQVISLPTGSWNCKNLSTIIIDITHRKIKLDTSDIHSKHAKETNIVGIPCIHNSNETHDSAKQAELQLQFYKAETDQTIKMLHENIEKLLSHTHNVHKVAHSVFDLQDFIMEKDKILSTLRTLQVNNDLLSERIYALRSELVATKENILKMKRVIEERDVQEIIQQVTVESTAQYQNLTDTIALLQAKISINCV